MDENIVRKTYKAEIKDFNDETGEVNLFIPLSSSEWDRDKEVVEPASIKKHLPNFMKHPVLVASHDYHDLTNQIGEWQKIKVIEKGTEGRPKYYIGMGNEQADWAYQLVKMGAAAFSYGFVPVQWEDGDGITTPRRTYKEIELLEISQVIIPSNREAIGSLRSKSVDDPLITELCNEVEKELKGDINLDSQTETGAQVVYKPEETDEYIRIPVDRGNHEGHRIRTIDISVKEGIKAIYCGTDKVVMTYLFAKDKGWTMEKAKAWVKEHESKALEEEIIVKEDNPKQKKDVSQAEIRDELDYLDNLITQSGLSKETAFDAVDVAIRTMARAWQYHQWESITFGENLTGQKEPIIFKREWVKSVWGESVKTDIGKMQEMHDMMSSCEIMANKSKKMAEDMMSEIEGERNLGSDIPINKKNNIDAFNIDDILKEVNKIKLGG